MKLRIGIDCRPLSRPASGIGKYTYELLTRLLNEHEVDWFLYSYYPISENIGKYNNVTFKHPKALSILNEYVWFHILLPQQLKEDKITVFWSPRHHLPYFLKEGIKSIVTIHDLTWIHKPRTMKLLNYLSEKILMPDSIKKADKIITISNHSRKDIEKQFNLPHSKINVISCATSTFKKIEQIDSIPSKYLLFVGAIEPRKNISRLLIAYKTLPEKLKNIYPLVLVTSNSWKISIGKLVKKLNLSKNIIILKNINDSELAYIYSKAKILLMPSLYEGFGLPILEAFQFGVPAITSNNSSMPEVLGNAGIKVNPYDIKEINEAIVKLLTNEALYKTCKEQTNIQVKKYSWKKSTRKFWKIIKKI